MGQQEHAGVLCAKAAGDSHAKSQRAKGPTGWGSGGRSPRRPFLAEKNTCRPPHTAAAAPASQLPAVLCTYPQALPGGLEACREAGSCQRCIDLLELLRMSTLRP